MLCNLIPSCCHSYSLVPRDVKLVYWTQSIKSKCTFTRKTIRSASFCGCIKNCTSHFAYLHENSSVREPDYGCMLAYMDELCRQNWSVLCLKVPFWSNWLRFDHFLSSASYTVKTSAVQQTESHLSLLLPPFFHLTSSNFTHTYRMDEHKLSGEKWNPPRLKVGW